MQRTERSSGLLCYLEETRLYSEVMRSLRKGLSKGVTWPHGAVERLFSLHQEPK